jgi:hypothetical protein
MADDRSVERIKFLVRERYETGAYGDCHFRMAPDALQATKDAAARPSEEPSYSGAYDGAIGTLLGIPVLSDPDLAPGSWRLVRLNGEVVEQYP